MRMRNGVKDISQQIRSPPGSANSPWPRASAHPRRRQPRARICRSGAHSRPRFRRVRARLVNDPCGEHDFGAVHIEGETVFWKIDWYERAIV
jgi:hypothetical protein